MQKLKLLSSTAVFLTACSLASHAMAGETLSQIKSRGELRCGVSEGIAGFSSRNKEGLMVGLDVDFCRAVAAAVLGDARKVSFAQLRASERFPALKASAIDLLVRNTTWTLSREAALKLQFAGILFYDRQGLMVAKKAIQAKNTPATKKKAPAKKPSDQTFASLDKAKICIEKSTTHLQHLTDYFAMRGMSFEPVVVDSTTGTADAFFAGKCTAYTADSAQLAVARARAPGGSSAYHILPEHISKEPLGPVVRAGDDDWLTLVRWVLFVLVGAEENGITRSNVLQRMREPAFQRILSASNETGKALGVDKEWAVRVIQSVGNYGEMYERNLGSGSSLKIERGLNQPWTKGGLMYSPPMR